jgi:D-cysteine desulfhydrase
VRRLPGLAEPAGAQVWVKDDGAYSPFGGNKARKLEWLLADARAKGHRTVLTGGALGTNHGLATALFAREAGLKTILVLVPQPPSEHVERQLERMRAAGAEIHFASGTAAAFARAASLIAARTVGGAGRPYLILPGGSVPLGSVGYANAGLELGEQVAAGELPEPSHVVVALGSGGTAAGLLLGLRLAGLRSRLVCVLVNDLTPISERSVARLANRTARLLRRSGAKLPARGFGAGDVTIERGWLGGGYGHSTAEGEHAGGLFSAEGVELEPVYTEKAAAALLELNHRRAFGTGPVLYWHTYGAAPSPAEIRAFAS